MTYGGQFEAQQSASRTILVFSGLVVVIMLILLQLAIGSLRIALLANHYQHLAEFEGKSPCCTACPPRTRIPKPTTPYEKELPDDTRLRPDHTDRLRRKRWKPQ